MIEAEQANPPALTSQRERIIAAARQVFLDGPPEQATMDAVAQRAGMSKKTIYREFKSQFELLAALLNESAADLGAAPDVAADADAEQELYKLVVRIVSHMTSARSMALVRLIISEIRRYPELIRHSKPKNAPQELVVAFLASPAIQARYVVDDPQETAAMLMAMVMHDMGFRLMISDGAMPTDLVERRAKRAVSTLLNGIDRKG